MKFVFAVVLALCVVATAGAQTLTINNLYGFDCQLPSPYFCPQGARPDSIMQASDGNYYGVAESNYDSHSNTAHSQGGTIFKLTPSGQFTLLYTFAQDTKTGFYDQGEIPNSLIEGSDGLLYGLAGAGGPNSASAGTAFRISKSGTGFQILQNFCTSCTTGGFPSSLTLGSDGNIYGTTGTGGSFSAMPCQGLGCGVVFRITTSGAFTALHALNGTTDGYSPFGMVQASDGNLYGIANEGGTGVGGTLFRLTHSGQFTVLHTFSGTGPVQGNGLTQASSGLLYGATHATGSTIIEIYSSTLSGSVQNVTQLNSTLTKKFTVSTLLPATDGNLWGVTSEGGSLNEGQVFAVSTGGTLLQQTLFNETDGQTPAGLGQASSGLLFGPTIERGTDAKGNSAYGAIFTINAGLPPR